MEKRINQFPLYFLPPVGFVSEFCSFKDPEILIGERFEKQTWRSRFEISGPNGRQVLSIPLVHKSTHSSLAEVQIDYSQNWNGKYWRSIETTYRKAPFFEFYAHYFEPLFIKKYFLLAEMSLESLLIILKVLKFKKGIILNTEHKHNIPLIDQGTVKHYNQVFIEKNGFLPDLSILDLIFNEGPLSIDYLDLS